MKGLTNKFDSICSLISTVDCVHPQWWLFHEQLHFVLGVLKAKLATSLVGILRRVVSINIGIISLSKG